MNGQIEGTVPQAIDEISAELESARFNHEKGDLEYEIICLERALNMLSALTYSERQKRDNVADH